jgi:hypothetical protein
MLAPKPTLASAAKGATKGQRGEDDESSRKQMAESEPRAAKRRRASLRWGAVNEGASAVITYVCGVI